MQKEMKELIDWDFEITEAFQKQTNERWVLKDVLSHHQDEIVEFLEAYYTGTNVDVIHEFWDCIFSMMTVMCIDELDGISKEEWLLGFKQVIDKINHRVETNHYKKLP